MKKTQQTLKISFLILFSSCLSIYAQDSIVGRDSKYIEVCSKAKVSDEIYNSFRSLPRYKHVVDVNNGKDFAEFILKNCMHLSNHFKIFEQLDKIGNPIIQSYPRLGSFNATTLRYIVVADQILKMFDLPENPTIVEIGPGFGGQCYILSKLQPFSKYYLYDLPEVNVLIERVLNDLKLENTKCLNPEQELPEDKIDFLISNYAFSECDYSTQMEYFNKVILKADKGYILYNQIAWKIHEMDSLSANEFFRLLSDNNMNPQMHRELVETDPDNFLITWDRTKK